MSRTVAIVGRPNVGKSRLFNRLARRRISIVHDQPGVTRDVISTEISSGSYRLLDTGGLGLKGGESTAELTAASERQVDFAIDASDLILFVIDGLEGITALDSRIAQKLRKSKKEVLLVLNKADFNDEKVDLAEAYRLGPLPESQADAEPVAKDASDPICVCFIGRPNVGKSSLGNRLLQSDRLIVSNVPGTTRDAIELPFTFRGRDNKEHPFILIDTAGIKAQTKLASPVEYFSRLRSLDAIQRADVVFLVLDALDGVTQQDKAIAGEAVKERKPIIVVVNKWDLVHEAFAKRGGIPAYKNERDYREKYEKALTDSLFFTPGSPLIFVSALGNLEVDRMLNSAVKISRVLDRKIPTAKLNQVLQKLCERTPPPPLQVAVFALIIALKPATVPSA